MTENTDPEPLSPARVRSGARIAGWIMVAAALVPVVFAAADPGSTRLFWVSLAITVAALGLIVRFMATQQPDSGEFGSFRDDPRTRQVLLFGAVPAVFASAASIALAVPSFLAAARGDAFVTGVFPDIDSHLVVGIAGPLLAIGLSWLFVGYLYSRRTSWSVARRHDDETTVF